MGNNANEIREEIYKELENITDIELLDFIHKLLLAERS